MKQKCSKSAPAVVRQRRGKRKQWSDASMVAAMEVVKEGTVSINRAALLHGVLPTTLKDRLSRRSSLPWN